MFELFPLSSDWLMALGSILFLNFILSGDNAIMIALACKNLPVQQRKTAIFWGSVGAAALRVVLTLVAAILLEIPYLQFFGGLALLWMAVQLLAKEGHANKQRTSSSCLSAAIKTVLIADILMSLDNVLALAAIAQTVPDSKYSLLIIGLAVSIPLVIFGSQLFMALMSKFPAITYIGAGILGYAAAEMIIADKALAVFTSGRAIYIQIILTLAVILIGHILKTRNRASTSPVTDPAKD